MAVVAIFYPFSQFGEVSISLPSLRSFKFPFDNFLTREIGAVARQVIIINIILLLIIKIINIIILIIIKLIMIIINILIILIHMIIIIKIILTILINIINILINIIVILIINLRGPRGLL